MSTSGFVLSVTDGTTTAVLVNGVNAHPLDYTPRVARSGDAYLDETVTMFWGSVSGGRAALETLGRLFDQARRYAAKGVGPRVYVLYRPDGSDEAARSEIVDGAVPPNDSLFAGAWGANYIEATITWRRVPYFELAEQALTLTNRNGSTAAGLTVWNHTDADAGHDNFVDIEGADVAGVLPAPVRVELLNNYDGGRAGRFYMGLHVFDDPSSFATVLEGEASSSGGTPIANGDASAGFYMARSWTGSTTVEAYRWSLSGAMLSAAGGNYYRVMARTLGSVSDNPPLWVRVRLELPGAYTVWQGAWKQFYPISRLTALDSLPLPPWLKEVATIGTLDLVIEGRRAVGVGVSTFLSVDNVQLLPLDGWRDLRTKGGGVQYNETLIDDGIRDRLYVLAGSAAYGHYVGSGSLMLVPGRDQRLYFLASALDNTTTPQRTFSAKVFYRPRVLTIEA